MRIPATRCLVISATLSIGIGTTTVPAEQELVYIESHTDAVGMTGPRVAVTSAILVSPDGKHVYAARMDSQTILGYQRDVRTGTLKWTQSVPLDPGQASPYSLALSPDGSHVYVPAAGDPLTFSSLIETTTRDFSRRRDSPQVP